MATRRAARQTAARVAGIGGALLVAAALAGALSTLEHGRRAPPGRSRASAPVVAVAPRPDAPAAAADAVPASGGAVPALHYPLQVGRYWVYRYREPGSEAVVEIERAIVRRQARTDGPDLYFFDDGSLVYFQDGRVYEMGSNGGVNIVPVGGQEGQRPVVYRSQGLQIERWLGATDTALVVEGRRFEGCLEVVTRFRSLGEDADGGVTYSSFYAPGVGMVARQGWPRDERGSLALTLADHGTREPQRRL